MRIGLEYLEHGIHYILDVFFSLDITINRHISRLLSALYWAKSGF